MPDAMGLLAETSNQMRTSWTSARPRLRCKTSLTS